MNKERMLIDLSHAGDRTTLESIEASTEPVMISHGAARALNPHIKRLAPDEVLKALAEKKGIIGISAIPNQLSSEKRQGIWNWLDHVNYITKLIRDDHVAIGLDNNFIDHVALTENFRSS